MDEVAEMLARYERQREKGGELIGRAWNGLRSRTRARLVRSGHFGKQGQRLVVEEAVDEIERLESALGACKAAVDAVFPKSQDDPIIIAAELLSPDIETGAHEILASGFAEPVFLRIALRAAILHERARAMSALTSQQIRGLDRAGGGKMEFFGTIVGIIFEGAAALGLPVSVAIMLTQAVAQNTVATGIAAYFAMIGASVLLRRRDRGIEALLPDEKDEPFAIRAFNAWRRLSYEPVVGGVGIEVRLREIAHNRVPVPLHVYDLAHYLVAAQVRPK